MSQSLYQLIPNLQAAVERETAIRNQSFLGFPEIICGIAVNHLTLRRMLLLEAVGSPFICGGAVTPYHIGAFFVAMADAKGFARWRLLRRVGLLNPAEAIEGIKDFLDESLQDAPPKRNVGETASYYSPAAAVIDVLASEYGWSRDQILDEPTKCLFQYLKAIQKRINPQAIQFNPSGRIICKYLEEQNALAGRN